MRKENVMECFLTDKEDLLLFFADDTMRKMKRSDLAAYDMIEGMDSVLTNDGLYESCFYLICKKEYPGYNG